MIGFLLASLVGLGAIGVGGRVLRRLQLTLSFAEWFAYGGALGLGVMAYLIFALGLLHKLENWLLLPLALLALLGIPEWYLLKKPIGSRNKELRVRTPLGRVLLRGLIGLLLLLSLLLVLLPPDGNDWDGLAYHLAFPKLYLQRGGIGYIPFMHHSNFPALLEMLYLWGLWASGTSCAKAFHWWLWLLTLVGTGAFVQRGGQARGEWAMLMLVSTPVALWEAGVAYADLATTCYTALGVFAFHRGLSEQDPRWLWLGGLLTGFALGTKYTALLTWSLLGVLGGLWLWRSGWKGGWRPLIAAGGLALLVGAPWYLKTYLYTGNPLYPFAYEIFGGRNWSQANAEAYRGDQLKFGMGRTPTEFLMLPWNLTVHPFKVEQGYPKPAFADPIGVKIGERYFLFATPGVTYLAGLFLMSVGQLPAGSGWLALFALGSMVGWFYLMQQVRYLIPVFPILSVLTVWSYERAGRGLKSLFATLLLLQSGFCLWLFGTAFLPYAPVALGLEPQESYLRQRLPIYPAIEYLNRFTPPSARVVMYDEVRGFYLQRDYIWGNPGHHTLIPYGEFQSADDLLSFLRSRGYTHLLLNRQFWVPNSQERWRVQIEEAIRKGLLRLLFSARRVEVYEIQEAADQNAVGLRSVGAHDRPAAGVRPHGGSPRPILETEPFAR